MILSQIVPIGPSVKNQHVTISDVNCDLERGSGLLPRVLLLDVSQSNPHLVDALSHQVDQGAVQLPIQALVYQRAVSLPF